MCYKRLDSKCGHGVYDNKPEQHACNNYIYCVHVMQMLLKSGLFCSLHWVRTWIFNDDVMIRKGVFAFWAGMNEWWWKGLKKGSKIVDDHDDYADYRLMSEVN